MIYNIAYDNKIEYHMGTSFEVGVYGWYPMSLFNVNPEQNISLSARIIQLE